LKSKVDYKRSDLPVFIQKMQQLAEDQRQELELAIIKRGKYQLRPQYRYLEVPEAKWFSLTQDQRQAHLKKFAQVCVGEDSNEQVSSHSSAEDVPLSVDVNDAASNSTVPLSIYQGIWSKASNLIRMEAAMASSPGYAAEAWTVRSATSNGFHIVHTWVRWQVCM